MLFIVMLKPIIGDCGAVEKAPAIHYITMIHHSQTLIKHGG